MASESAEEATPVVNSAAIASFIPGRIGGDSDGLGPQVDVALCASELSSIEAVFSGAVSEMWRVHGRGGHGGTLRPSSRSINDDSPRTTDHSKKARTLINRRKDSIVFPLRGSQGVTPFPYPPDKPQTAKGASRSPLGIQGSPWQA